MRLKIAKISSSLMSLLRESEASAAPDVQLECIREDMLELMSPFVEHQVSRPAVWGAVLYANDVQALWYQRTAVMHLLSEHIGEHAAREKLDTVTRMFRGHLPSAQFASARLRA